MGGVEGEDGVSNSECKQAHTPPQAGFTDQCSLRSVLKHVPQGVELQQRPELGQLLPPQETHSWVGLSCSRDPVCTQGGGPPPARPPTLLKPATLPPPSACTRKTGQHLLSLVLRYFLPAACAGVWCTCPGQSERVCQRLRPAHTLSSPPACHPWPTQRRHLSRQQHQEPVLLPTGRLGVELWLLPRCQWLLGPGPGP